MFSLKILLSLLNVFFFFFNNYQPVNSWQIPHFHPCFSVVTQPSPSVSQPSTSQGEEKAPELPKPKKNRCFMCRKKVGLTGMTEHTRPSIFYRWDLIGSSLRDWLVLTPIENAWLSGTESFQSGLERGQDNGEKLGLISICVSNPLKPFISFRPSELLCFIGLIKIHPCWFFALFSWGEGSWTKQ